MTMDQQSQAHKQRYCPYIGLASKLPFQDAFNCNVCISNKPCISNSSLSITSLHVLLNILENADAVMLGGFGSIRLFRKDFLSVKAARKPTVMTLHLVDTLFSKDILLCSTVHGTEEYAPLDQQIIAAIKGKLNDSTLYEFNTFRFFHMKGSKPLQI